MCSAYFGDYNELVYLRARHYAPGMGRFLTRDMWAGNANLPISLNRWNYTYSNPINFVDPSGFITETEGPEANSIMQRLRVHQVNVAVDWGYPNGKASWNYWYNDPTDSSKSGIRTICNAWGNGLWSIEELRDVEASITIILGGVRYLGGNYRSLWGPVTIRRETGQLSGTSNNQLKLRDDIKNENRRSAIIVHEMAHALSHYNPSSIIFFLEELGAECINSASSTYCNSKYNNGTYRPGPYAGLTNEHLPSTYASIGSWEDYAETFTVIVSEAYIRSGYSLYKSDAKNIYNQKTYNHDIGRRRKIMKIILNGTWR